MHLLCIKRKLKFCIAVSERRRVWTEIITNETSQRCLNWWKQNDRFLWYHTTQHQNNKTTIAYIEHNKIHSHLIIYLKKDKIQKYTIQISRLWIQFCLLLLVFQKSKHCTQIGTTIRRSKLELFFKALKRCQKSKLSMDFSLPYGIKLMFYCMPSKLHLQKCLQLY